MVSVEYRNAYSEVLEILQHISSEELNKIPKEMIGIFKQNANDDYKFKYNPNKTLKEQNVSKRARYIIAILFRDYWATPEQREKIKAKERYDLRKIEEQKKEKYSYENLFRNNTKDKTDNNNKKMIVYKTNIFQKIIGEIKRILRK